MILTVPKRKVHLGAVTPTCTSGLHSLSLGRPRHASLHLPCGCSQAQWVRHESRSCTRPAPGNGPTSRKHSSEVSAGGGMQRSEEAVAFDEV